MRKFLVLVSMLAAGGGTAAVAQKARWSLGAELGESRFGGTTRTTASGDVGSFRPFRPTTMSLRFDRHGARVRLGMAMLYARAAAALESREVSVLARDTPLELLELAPDLSVRIMRLGAAASLRADAGPVVDFWRWEVAEPRTRVGGRVGAALEAALGTRFHAVVRAGLAVTPSVFDDADLPPEFARRPSWRRSVALGLQLVR